MAKTSKTTKSTKKATEGCQARKEGHRQEAGNPRGRGAHGA